MSRPTDDDFPHESTDPKVPAIDAEKANYDLLLEQLEKTRNRVTGLESRMAAVEDSLPRPDRVWLFDKLVHYLFAFAREAISRGYIADPTPVSKQNPSTRPPVTKPK